MISHFQIKPLYKNSQLPGWHLSFFFKGQSIKATYHKDGKIEFDDSTFSPEEIVQVEKQIHELMLFHVYE
ncbi:YheE family protein [Sutcliffiella sp. NPDC057660]|uniref:YheE family protein n=1 Tax=Sutcliffiella sp. NPDC057660 TaxID=3346199 RepID=UPI0036ABACBB